MGFLQHVCAGSNSRRAFVVILALAALMLLRPFNVFWFKFGSAIYKIVTPVAMAFLFFVAVTPAALVMRALGKVPLSLDFEPGKKTYWIERRPPGPAPETMKNQF